jgi:hypothetical protein
MQQLLSAAAFVPFDDTPLDERSTLAIRWILDRERETGRRAGLIVPLMRDYGEPIESFERGRPSSSPKSSKSFGSGPVLVFCTGMEGLAKAARSDAEVAYVAWGNDLWVFGWAAAVGAINLRSGQQEEPPSPKVRELLDELAFAGNNGWYDNPGKRDARRILGLLDQQVSRDFTAGAMLARGHSVNTVKDLRALH